LFKRIKQLRRQARNYSNIIVWLLYSAFKGRTRQLVSALLFSLLHLGGQGAAILAIYWWARQMEQNGTVSVPLLGIQFAARDEPAFLWVVVIFAALCLVLGACSLFLSRVLVLNIVRDNYAQGVDRLIFFVSRLPDPRSHAGSLLLLRYGLNGLITGCRRVALTAIEFANAIPAVIGGAAAVAFLFGVDPWLTFSILSAFVFGAALLYPLALRASSVSEHLQKAKIAFKAEIRQLKRTQFLSPLRLKTSHALANAALGPRRVRTEFAFAIGIGVSAILLFVVYYLANKTMGRSEGWAIFIAYIGALRLALAGGSHAITAIVSVSRFYPQIMRYYVFTHNAEMIDKRILGKVSRGDVLTLGYLKSGADIVVKVGQRIALITTDKLEQMRFAFLGARAAHSALPLGTAMVKRTDGPIVDAAVAIVDLDKLMNGEECAPSGLGKQFDDAVTLIVHRDAKNVGSAGETHLLTLDEGEFRRFAPLGTSESSAALEEFSRRVTRRGRKRLHRDDDEEDQEEDES
jgi:hypothetical protein